LRNPLFQFESGTGIDEIVPAIFRVSLSRSTLNYCLVSFYALMAILLCVFFVQNFAVNGVWQDEWAFIPYLRDLQAGKLDFWQLFISQHNEHRLWVAAFVLILTGNTLHYDGIAIQDVGLCVIAMTVLMMCVITWRRANTLKFGSFLLIPVILLGFSLRQWENLISTCPFAAALLPCTFIGTILLLEGIGSSRAFGMRLALATFLAFTCTFCFANGVLAYPLGLLTLFLPDCLTKQPISSHTKLSALVFGGAGLLTLASYALTFTGFGANTATHLTVSRLLSHPVVYAKRLVLCLATPLVGVPAEAYPVGAMVGIILLITLFLLVKNRPKVDQKVVVPLMLALFGLLSTLMVFYARADAPLNFFLSSHYASFLNLWVVGIYAMLLGLLSSGLEKSSRRLAAAAAGALALMMIVCPLLSIKEGIETGELIRTIRLVAANKLLNYQIQPDESLLDECYSAKWVRYLAPYLEEKHLSVFAYSSCPTQNPNNVQSTNRNIACHIECAGPSFDTTATTTHEGPPVITYPVAKVSGWIEAKASQSKVARILVKTDASTTYQAAYSLYRPDLIARYNDSSLRRSGFSFVCDPHKALGQSKMISIIAEDENGKYFLLAQTIFGSNRKENLAAGSK
jgi:hypothetical protein